MASFKLVVSEPETKKSHQMEIDSGKAISLMGKKIGDEVSGNDIGFTGYALKITGGTDKDGFPMHPSVAGTVKKRMLLSGTPGFHPKIKGQRKRKMVRGNAISDDIVQINFKVVKRGEKPLEEIAPLKPKEKKEEKPATKEEKPLEAKPAEAKPKAEEKTGGEGIQKS